MYSKCSSHAGKCSTIFHKPQNTFTAYLSHSTSSYLLTVKTQAHRLKTCKWKCTVFFVFIFIAPNCKQPSCSSHREWSHFGMFIQGTRLHNKKKKNTKICSHRDGFQSVKGEKQTQRPHIIQFHYVIFSKRQNYRDKNIGHRLLWAQARGKGLKGIFWCDGNDLSAELGAHCSVSLCESLWIIHVKGSF